MTTTDLARHLVLAYQGDNRPIESLEVRRVTEGVFACKMHVIGEVEPEARFISLKDE